ncbi:MAG TPA: hypothetical protein VH597_13130 [Verrucomicrobiae bacterium]|jgi:hypothetical protein|nr:hypothetical protein [Verrucomicrobiae bacterium]
MKKKIMRLGILPLITITAGSVLLSGCVSHHREAVFTTEPVTTTTRTVVVTEEPPPPRTEIEGTAPSEAQVWTPGYWTNVNGNWVWMPGHWELRPRVNAVWVPGHWDKNSDGKGWIWTAGRWE